MVVMRSPWERLSTRSTRHPTSSTHSGRIFLGPLDCSMEKNLFSVTSGNKIYLYLLDCGCILLVDFDGVGRDGADRYSAYLNPNAGLGVVH